jgi:ElaB/YqjD/DUF883 family membrane-anchored ribosome-binding protein
VKEVTTMDERRLESVTGRAQEAAQRAGAYAQERAREMRESVERQTGRSMEAWVDDARHYVRQHPLQAIVLTIGLGFVLGKLLSRD